MSDRAEAAVELGVKAVVPLFRRLHKDGLNETQAALIAVFCLAASSGEWSQWDQLMEEDA